jgi:hypothetical protein
MGEGAAAGGGLSGFEVGGVIGAGTGAAATGTSTGGRSGVLLGGGGAGEQWVADSPARPTRREPIPRLRVVMSEQGIPDGVQPKNPLHGITLETIVTELVEYYGWPALGEQIDIRCFTHDPSIASSLKFLRRTPWARAKVESLYLFVQRERARQART